MRATCLLLLAAAVTASLPGEPLASAGRTVAGSVTLPGPQLPLLFPEPSEPEPEDPPPRPAVWGLEAYEGLGGWVDAYDYGHSGSMAPDAVLDELARRGVRTLYLQTGRWTFDTDMANAEAAGALIEKAHARNLKVVGWYLAGFADIDMDVRRSLAAINFRTPSGQRFDGFAPDIEERGATRGDRERFNRGVVEYSRRLREFVPEGTALGAIVPDAKNNERAPAHWSGFPWPEIARYYNVVMPMAYWSVTKRPSTCRSVEMDARGYIREVVEKTQALMGTTKPMHPVGGIADCDTTREVRGYVDALHEKATMGGGLYDFLTTNDNPARDSFWAELARVNQPRT
jgi:hypothetical protein